MRSCPFALAILLTSLFAATAVAGTSAPGLNLRWDQCFVDGGVQHKNFACNTNSGSDRMVGSFELASAPPAPISGLEIRLDVMSVGTLPTWWHFFQTISCRRTSMTMSATPPAGAAACSDWASGQAIGGIGAYDIGRHGVSNAYITVASAVPSQALAQLQGGREYFAFSLTINHAKTVGTGSCAGCETPAVIFLAGIRLADQDPACDILLTEGANWSGSQWISWQQGYPLDVTRNCGLSGPLCGGCSFPSAIFTTVPYDVTPARASTWGAVKSLYR